MRGTLRHLFQRELAGAALPLIAFCVALNLTVGQITALFKIPLYLDSIGTILAAVLCGFIPAMIAGVTSNIMAAALGNPPMVFFFPVSIVIAAGAVAFNRAGAFRRWPTVILAGALMGAVSATASAPISAYLFSGTTLAGTDALVLLFRSEGFSVLKSTFLQGLLSDTTDKVVAFLIVYRLTSRLPGRLKERFRSGPYLPAGNAE